MAAPTVFITGITGGIGSALARHLHANGWLLGGCAQRRDRLDALASELPGTSTCVADVRDGAAIESAIRTFSESKGALNAVVHAVGSIYLKPAHLTSTDDFRATLEINLVSAFQVLRAGIQVMQAQGSGSILLFSSAAAQVGLQNHEAIAAAKAGIEGLVRAAAATYAPKGIRVNALAPGLVDTPLASGLVSSEPARVASEKAHPMGRIGRPVDIVPAAALLIDPAATWISGQCWSVDGGLASLRVRR